MSPTGHLAIGFAAKKYAPKIPLVVFLIAANAIDLMYFLFLALGLDTIDFDPWSHSLFMAVIWSVCAGLITILFSGKFSGGKYRNGLVMALVVFSHWILDFVVWDNLPIFLDKAHVVGLGLYDKIGFSITGLKMDSGTIIATSLELGLLIIGVGIYILYSRKLRREKSALPTK
jgi:hypothetical protein